ncbi:ribbon-helix-helix domain-containing protein [Halogeometricum sp. CBA1124]|uniref:ribbon-helix-helix domain-containing protein n=1 Tax=Halogeometricum sp. CBA1124 TaxID=2668071 RepID=UPI001747F1BF
MQQTTVSSRIPRGLDEALEAACQSERVFRSEIIRRALRYYFEQNPDGIELAASARGEKGNQSSPNRGALGLATEEAYDPVTEF